MGFALGYRPDLVLALGLAHCWLLWRGRTDSTWKPALGGFVVGLVPFMAHLVIAGIGPSVRGMFLRAGIRPSAGPRAPAATQFRPYRRRAAGSR